MTTTYALISRTSRGGAKTTASSSRLRSSARPVFHRDTLHHRVGSPPDQSRSVLGRYVEVEVSTTDEHSGPRPFGVFLGGYLELLMYQLGELCMAILVGMKHAFRVVLLLH